MKIAFILSRFPVLSQTFVVDQIVGLLKKGHDIHIITRSIDKSSLCHGNIEQYKLMKRIKNRTSYMGYYENSIYILINLVRYVVQGDFVKMSAVFKLIMNRQLDAIIMHRLISKEYYDIIHCHFGPNGIIPAYLKKIGLLDISLIVTFHGYDMNKYVQKFGKESYNDIFSYADKILPISNFWKKQLIELGCHEEKIEVHHMGINTSKYIRTNIKREKDNKIRILSIGRLVKKKGLNYAIKAVSKIGDDYNLEYCIAGAGPERDVLISLIEKYKAQDYIKLLGPIDDVKGIELYKAADIFLLPSVTADDGDMEGIPVVLMEAMAMQIPIISTYHSGIPELVEEGVTGFLVKEKDVEGIAEKLRILIGHSVIRYNMGRNGREKVQENFNIHILNKKLNDIFNDLAIN